MTDPNRDTLAAVDTIGRWIVGAAILLVLVAYGLLGGDGASGAIAGAAIADGVWWSSGAIGRRMTLASDRARVGWALAFVAQGVLVLALSAAALTLVSPAGFAIGFSAIVLGPIAGSLALGFRARAQTKGPADRRRGEEDAPSSPSSPTLA